jgi:DNA-binding MarR family transcriptional regulator
LTNSVNGDLVILPTLFEGALREMRVGLHQLSETRFPGLRTRHYRLLGFIPPQGIRPARMVELSGLTKQALAQALAPLEEGSYVAVTPDPADRRARVVRLTDRGREVMDALVALQEGYENQWGARVGRARWTAAREVLIDLFVRSSPDTTTPVGLATPAEDQ